MNHFNANRHETMPELHPVTEALLTNVWTDDFESFALVNEEEDKEAYIVVKQLDVAIRGLGIDPEQAGAIAQTVQAAVDEDLVLLWELVQAHPYQESEIGTLMSDLYMFWNE